MVYLNCLPFPVLRCPPHHPKRAPSPSYTHPSRNTTHSQIKKAPLGQTYILTVYRLSFCLFICLSVCVSLLHTRTYRLTPTHRHIVALKHMVIVNIFASTNNNHFIGESC